MVLSMTGYGRAGALLHGRDIKVELRSVNARFFEYSSRLPRSCAFLEDKLKKLVASKVSRGKVELSLSIQTVTAADTVVTVNWQLAEGYRAALNAMAERMDLKNDVSVGMLSRFPDVLTQTAAPTNEDELWEDVRTVAEQAVDAFVAMRAVEGEKMKADVAGRLTTIETLVAKIEENSAGRVQTRRFHRLKAEFFAKCQAERPVCWLCGQPIDYSADPGTTADSLTLDHRVPVSKRPDLQEDPANFEPAHFACNSRRGNSEPPVSLGVLSRKWTAD